MGHVASAAPTGELLPSPHDGEHGQHDRKVYPYGVGIDCHSKFFEICVLVPQATDLTTSRLKVNAEWPQLCAAHQWVLSILRRHAIAVRPEELRYTLESTGQYHMPLCLAWKGRPSIINPSDTSATRRKTDVLDAGKLALQSLTGLWRESWVATAQVQELRVLTLQRTKLVAERTRLSNRINGDMLRFGHLVGQLGAVRGKLVRALIEDFCREGRVGLYAQYFSDQRTPPGVLVVLEQHWRRIDEITREVELIESLCLKRIKDSTWTVDGGRTVSGAALLGNLETVPGVGTWTACVWLAEIGDITRFSHPKKLCAYAGLDPSLGVSAGKVTSRLKRKGNARLNGALRNAVRAAVSNPVLSSFTGWVRGYIGRHVDAGKSKALKAMARRLCKALYYVHLRCEPFNEAKYRPLLSESSYTQCSVDDMGFTPRVARILKENGLLTSKQVVEAFYGDLARRPGCGSSTVKQVAAWVNQQQRAPVRTRAADRPPKDATH
jgi:transposase